MLSENTDRNGHKLFFKGNRIFLQLRNETRIRTLGEVVGDTFYTRRNDSKHRMRNRKDLGFNYSLIKRGRFSKVVVQLDDGTELHTTREKILQTGECKHFMGQGFELQIFLPQTEFEIIGSKQEAFV